MRRKRHAEELFEAAKKSYIDIAGFVLASVRTTTNKKKTDRRKESGCVVGLGGMPSRAYVQG
jgi:hypothetical protein